MNRQKYVYKIWYEQIVETEAEVVAETIHEAEVQLKGRRGRILHTTELRRYEGSDEPVTRPG